MKSFPSFHSRARLLLLPALLVCNPVVVASIISYTYDPAGRIVAADYGANQTASYAYDNAGNLLQSSQPSPGLIFNPLDPTHFVLFWPTTPTGFVLESSPTIGAGAVWTNAGATLTPDGNRVTATIPITGSVQFFRLHKP